MPLPVPSYKFATRCDEYGRCVPFVEQGVAEQKMRLMENET
jgi:hypothetical protein